MYYFFPQPSDKNAMHVDDDNKDDDENDDDEDEDENDVGNVNILVSCENQTGVSLIIYIFEYILCFI